MTPREEAEREKAKQIYNANVYEDGVDQEGLVADITAALTACREERDGEIAALRSQVERLREALERYGKHECRPGMLMTCVIDSNGRVINCICGLSAALSSQQPGK